MSIKMQRGGTAAPKSGIAPPLLSEALRVSDQKSSWISSRASMHPSERPKYSNAEIDLRRHMSEAGELAKSMESRLDAGSMGMFSAVDGAECLDSFDLLNPDIRSFDFDQPSIPIKACKRFQQVIESEEACKKKESGVQNEDLPRENFESFFDNMTVLTLNPSLFRDGDQRSVDAYTPSRGSYSRSGNASASSYLSRTVTASGLRREQFSTVMKMFGSYGRIVNFRFGSKSATVTFSTQKEADEALELDCLVVCGYLIRVRKAPPSDHVLDASWIDRYNTLGDRSWTSSNYPNPIQQYSPPHTECDISDSNTTATYVSCDPVDKPGHCYNLYEKPKTKSGAFKNSCYYDPTDPIFLSNVPDTPNANSDINDSSECPAGVRPLSALCRLLNWIFSFT